MSKYVEKAGILDSYSVDGIATAKGSFDLTGASTSQIGWSGVGQYNDLVNPCAMMVWMGAIANQGKTAVPYLISKTEGDLPLPSLPHFTKKTDQLIDADTAQVVGDMMANNVRETYGSSRFPNMDICAKSGTAEVGGGKSRMPGLPASCATPMPPMPLWWYWRRAAAAPMQLVMWRLRS